MNSLIVLLALIGCVVPCLYKNERFEDGDTWVVRSTFVMKCVIKKGGWSTMVVGCRTPAGVVVEPGKTIKEKETTYECVSMGNGKVEIKRTYAIDASKGCEGHPLGETWVSQRNFRKECTAEGVRIKECLTDVGIPVALNGNLVLSGIVYTCAMHPNGTVSINREAVPTKSNTRLDNLSPIEVLGPMYKRIHSLGKLLPNPIEDAPPKAVLVAPAAQKVEPNSIQQEIVCATKGKTYKPEETWISENKFTKKCTPDGSVIILNCLINDQTTINVNSELKLGKNTYKCYRNENEGRVYLEITENETVKTL